MPRYGMGFRVSTSVRQALAELVVLHRQKLSAFEDRVDTLKALLQKDYLTFEDAKTLDRIISNMHNPGISKTEAVMTESLAAQIKLAVESK